MRIALERIEALPRLAWCARMSRGADVVEVRHGPGVETWDEGFCEGAWDGPFAEAGFDRAIAFSGTGGRLRGGEILFVSGTALGDRLYLLRRGRDLFISNSVVFAMVAAGDEPSRGYPYYEHHYFKQAREGLHTRHRRLPTRRAAVALHECANLTVSASLSVRRIEKPAPPAPCDFKGYVSLLDESMGAVFRNADDPARRVQRYHPLATVSRGYDSPALAVLARQNGCRKAVTFLGSGDYGGDDDGREIGGLLGFEMRVYRSDAPPEGLFPEAEFCVCPHGTTRAWLPGERDLPGALVLSGAPAGYLLGTAAPAPPDLRRKPKAGMGGTQNEFRLRVGFNVFKPWFTGWQHADAIHRITRSEEMRPWWVGGLYDKPIARRILEEAGVPRGAFGTRKMATVSNALLSPADLAEGSRIDYAEFLRRLRVPRRLRVRRWIFGWLEGRPRGRSRRWLRNHVPGRWRRAAGDGYLFHWGFEHTQRRYHVGRVVACGGTSSGSSERSPG